MIPLRIAGATRHLGAPKGWNPETDGPCGHLEIADIEAEGGVNIMMSSWEPTPLEIAAIIAGAPVMLQVVGLAHPPVMIWVDEGYPKRLSDQEKD